MNNDSPKYVHVKVTINGNELYRCGFEEPEVLIGRSPECQVLLENAGVSRNHAKIVREHDQLKVVDLLSGNGTFVNGQQVKQAIIGSGDTIRIGKFTLYVSLSDRPLNVPQPQAGPKSSEAMSGTVFLRPEERAAILQQSKPAPARERPPAKPLKARFPWGVASFSLVIGVAIGLIIGWGLVP